MWAASDCALRLSRTTAPACDRKEVRLIELPAPHSVSCAGQSVASATPWLFYSEPITDNDGFAHTARWTWTANDHNPCILHGAAVVQHPSQPFLVACKVRGEASIPLANGKLKLKRRLRFDSDELGPRLWYFHPLEPESDLLSFEQAITGLNAETKEMNLRDCIRESHYSSDHPVLLRPNSNLDQLSVVLHASRQQPLVADWPALGPMMNNAMVLARWRS